MVKNQQKFIKKLITATVENKKLQLRLKFRILETGKIIREYDGYFSGLDLVNVTYNFIYFSNRKSQFRSILNEGTEKSHFYQDWLFRWLLFIKNWLLVDFWFTFRWLFVHFLFIKSFQKNIKKRIFIMYTCIKSQ